VPSWAIVTVYFHKLVRLSDKRPVSAMRGTRHFRAGVAGGVPARGGWMRRGGAQVFINGGAVRVAHMLILRVA
jgi:hypothetical protein